MPKLVGQSQETAPKIQGDSLVVVSHNNGSHDDRREKENELKKEKAKENKEGKNGIASEDRSTQGKPNFKRKHVGTQKLFL